MAGSHLERTGYSHGVMAIASITALVSAMWSSSSFVGSISDHPLTITPTIEGGYSAAARYAIAVIVLNSCVAFMIVIVSLFIDWHLNAIIPATVEYTWVGIAWCLELVVVILMAGAGPAAATCKTDHLTPSEQVSGQAICSNWKAILVSAIIALLALTFHISWHMIFRLWHRAALASRPNTPVDIWATPLPRNYPISPREKQEQRDDNVFITLDEAPPTESNALDPYSLMFTPAAVQKAQHSAREASSEHTTPAASARVSTDDLEKSAARDDASITSCKGAELIPPGLEIAVGTRKSQSTEN